MVEAGTPVSHAGGHSAAARGTRGILRCHGYLGGTPEGQALGHAGPAYQLDVAMLWIEEIRTPRHNVDDVAPQARTIFDRLTPILEGGLSTAKGYRAADVVAHLGWLNFLKGNITGQNGIV